MRQEEQAKYEKMWTFDRYRVVAPGEKLVNKAISSMGMRYGSSVLDLGCGTGRAAQQFKDLGFFVIGVDFAANCLDDDIDIIFRQVCLWEPFDLPSDYGFCTDVMEHIPTDYVGDVLENIYLNVTEGCFFQIATRKDGMGRLIGQPLHLTVKSSDWWEKALKRHFPKVNVLEATPNNFIAVVEK